MEFPFILIVVVAIVAVVIGAIASSKRRKELAAWAAGKGLRFDKSKDRGLDSQFKGFKCLQQGSSRYGYNLIEGNWNGLEMLAFDYHYVTGSGKNRSSHLFSAVILRSLIPLKPLYIRREGFLDKITEFFGMDDIDFESAEFSRKFFVKAPDRRWAYDVIHQRMMQYLMASPNFSIQFDAHHVIVWRSNRFSAGTFELAARFIVGMLDRLPDYIVRQQSETADGRL